MCETIWKKCAVFIKLPECHMNTCIKDTWPNTSSTYIYVHEFTNCKHQSNRFRTDYLTSNIAFLQAYLTEEIVQVKSSNNSESNTNRMNVWHFKYTINMVPVLCMKNGLNWLYCWYSLLPLNKRSVTHVIRDVKFTTICQYYTITILYYKCCWLFITYAIP